MTQTITRSPKAKTNHAHSKDGPSRDNETIIIEFLDCLSKHLNEFNRQIRKAPKYVNLHEIQMNDMMIEFSAP